MVSDKGICHSLPGHTIKAHFISTLVQCIVTIVCSRSLLCKKYLNNFVILHDMHMGLESLESALKSTSFDTKTTSIADWEHVEPENTIYIAMA